MPDVTIQYIEILPLVDRWDQEYRFVIFWYSIVLIRNWDFMIQNMDSDRCRTTVERKCFEISLYE